MKKIIDELNNTAVTLISPNGFLSPRRLTIKDLNRGEEPRKYMSLEQVAEYTGISRASINRYVVNRVIPFIRLPSPSKSNGGKKGMMRFDREQIDLWMKKKMIKNIDAITVDSKGVTFDGPPSSCGA
jgi:excisionase family DNA binding protein